MSDRRSAARTHNELIARVEALLFAADPIGINFETNADEYNPEAVSIIARRGEFESVDALQRVVHEEFVRWFDANTAGPIERYRSIAAQIWQVWTTDHIERGMSDAY